MEDGSELDSPISVLSPERAKKRSDAESEEGFTEMYK
jgi:hypothetical protein